MTIDDDTDQLLIPFCVESLLAIPEDKQVDCYSVMKAKLHAFKWKSQQAKQEAGHCLRLIFDNVHHINKARELRQ